MQKYKYAIGRFARKLGRQGSFENTSQSVLTGLYCAGMVFFISMAFLLSIRSEAWYDNNVGAPFYKAGKSHDAGQMATYLEDGLAAVHSLGLDTGHAVTVTPEDPSNDTAVTAAGIESFIVRLRAVDALDHKSEAYQLGMTDVKTQFESVDYGMFFARWNRLGGYWKASFKSIGWAIWNSIVLGVLGLATAVALWISLNWLHDKAESWDDALSTT